MSHQQPLSKSLMDCIGEKKSRTLLLVSSDELLRATIEPKVSGLGYRTAHATSAANAFNLLEADAGAADAIMIDTSDNDTARLHLAERLNAHSSLRTKPVIMLSSELKADQISEADCKGIFFQLTKPIVPAILQSVIAAAMRRSDDHDNLASALRSRRSGMSCVQNAKFQFKSPSQSQDLAISLSGCFSDPERAVLGISELFTNAIEHGNLEIGFKLKSELLERNGLKDEIERRLELRAYADRCVDVQIVKKPAGVYIVITDQGPGFNPRDFLQLTPSRSSSKNGRGIAQARVSAFDKLAYNAKGNQVVGFMADRQPFAW